MEDHDQQPAQRLDDNIELILQIGLQINAEHDLDRLLQLTVQAVKDSLKYSYCSILLKEGPDLVIRAVTEYPDTIIGRRIPIGEGITGRCAATGTESLVPDVSQCPHFVQLATETFQSELDVPIIFREKVLGVLNTQSTLPNAYGAPDLHTLKVLATQIGVALYNAHIRTQLELVQEIGLQLAIIVKSQELFPWIVEQIQQRLHHDSCAILRVDGDHLVLEACTRRISSAWKSPSAGASPVAVRSSDASSMSATSGPTRGTSPPASQGRAPRSPHPSSSKDNCLAC
jgi:GAF domain-containing protein